MFVLLCPAIRPGAHILSRPGPTAPCYNPRTMRMLTVVAGLILLGARAAAAQSPAVDPCTLLTPAEIKIATGLEVRNMAINKQMDPAAGALCDFKLGDLGSGGIVIHQLRPGETRETMMVELLKRKIDCLDAPTLGVPSFYASPGYGMVQLNSFKGETQVIVQLLIIGKTSVDTMAMTAKLMRAALVRVK
jgi:hypothetical protein